MKRHGFGLVAQRGLPLCLPSSELSCGWQDLGDLVAVVQEGKETKSAFTVHCGLCPGLLRVVESKATHVQPHGPGGACLRLLPPKDMLGSYGRCSLGVSGDIAQVVWIFGAFPQKWICGDSSPGLPGCCWSW